MKYVTKVLTSKSLNETIFIFEDGKGLALSNYRTEEKANLEANMLATDPSLYGIIMVSSTPEYQLEVKKTIASNEDWETYTIAKPDIQPVIIIRVMESDKLDQTILYDNKNRGIGFNGKLDKQEIDYVVKALADETHHTVFSTLILSLGDEKAQATVQEAENKSTDWVSVHFKSPVTLH